MRRVGELFGRIEARTLSDPVLYKLEYDARSLSSFSSTKIEGNTLNLTEVKKLLKSVPKIKKDTEREVLNYNKALILLNKKIKDNKIVLSNGLVYEVQKTVVDGLVGKSFVGKYRSDPVFVNDPVTRTTIYWPPDAKDILPLMTDLIKFINSQSGKIDPLILAGLFHKQFVLVHPFIDGNGRTARLITKAVLAQLGLNTFPLLSFENYYNNNISKYFEYVGVKGDFYSKYYGIDFTDWLEYFTTGIEEEIARVIDSIPAYQERIANYESKLLNYINKKGSINSQEYGKLTGRSKAARTKDFKKLIQKGVIKSFGKGKATYYEINWD